MKPMKGNKHASSNVPWPCSSYCESIGQWRGVNLPHAWPLPCSADLQHLQAMRTAPADAAPGPSARWCCVAALPPALKFRAPQRRRLRRHLTPCPI